ncbi:hypothetical protein ACFYT3_22480 [Nocardia amikacinitolerans]|uniref:hypothetical protein n=1 Tax=Nocardia amikacinitolerans TaxID=756689 RepID=UPI0036C88D1A
MRSQGSLPIYGHIVWLTAEQGGRQSGPPDTPAGFEYVSTGYVPPYGGEELASFVLRVEDRTAWRSSATARWLAFDNVGAQSARHRGHRRTVGAFDSEQGGGVGGALDLPAELRLSPCCVRLGNRAAYG